MVSICRHRGYRTAGYSKLTYDTVVHPANESKLGTFYPPSFTLAAVTMYSRRAIKLSLRLVTSTHSFPFSKHSLLDVLLFRVDTFLTSQHTNFIYFYPSLARHYRQHDHWHRRRRRSLPCLCFLFFLRTLDHVSPGVTYA